VRGQLYDVRLSTQADIGGDWDRGCLQFFYSANMALGGSGTDNNGNLVAQQYWIPGAGMRQDNYFMQNDQSLSWQGGGDWTKTLEHHSSDYTNVRSQSSSGVGYVLDFHDHAYDRSSGTGKRWYDPVKDNCGQAFNVAINAISKSIGVPTTHAVRPSQIGAYIQKYLKPRGFVADTKQFPVHR